MKKVFAMVLAATMVAVGANAQTVGQDCRCEESFEWLRSTFETNDAGFGYIVERKGHAAYDLHNRMMLEKVSAAQNWTECRVLLTEWLSFFRRGHIGLQMLLPDQLATTAAQNTQQSSAPATEPEMWKGNIVAFEKEIATRENPDFEGIWEFPIAKMGVKAEGDGYTGFVMESREESLKPGQIMMRITHNSEGWRATAYNGPRTNIVDIELVGNGYFLLGGSQMVKRISPEFPVDSWVESYVNSLRARTPYVEQLNPTTLYMRIRSFDHILKPAIDKIIADNLDKITNTENLIIDVRGNGGGSDISYKELLPLIYTNPVRTPAVSFLSTPLNIKNTEALLDIAELDEETRKEVTALTEKMKANPDEYVPMTDEAVDVETLDTIYEFPRSVGIIINDACASATEQFLLAAKQSRKVKLFGTTTSGALDASNVRTVDSPDGRYRLRYTTSLSSRIPGMAIDDVGLQPDYYLDKTIPDYKWVEFVSGVLNE
jgi:hypothetical protein